MPEINPPLFVPVQQAYSADELALPWRDIVSEGVVGAGDLLVGPRAAGANKSVDVGLGACWIAGDDNPAAQGTYRMRSDSIVNLAIAANASGNPRVDRIIARVYDSTFAGVQNLWALEVLEGVPTAGATKENALGAIAVPNNAIELARVELANGYADIAAGQIFDARTRYEIAAPSGGGWSVLSGAWAFGAADAPTFTMTAAGDRTAEVWVGCRIKLTHAAAVKYFIVTAVAYAGGTTTVTLYGGTDYVLAAGAISLVNVSSAKAPSGFPLDPIKWTQEYESAANAEQTAPTGATWYNVGANSLVVPIGAWTLEYRATLYCNTNNQNSFNCWAKATLSTANNSESDPDFSEMFLPYFSSAASLGHRSSVGRSKDVLLAGKTTYYLNARMPSGDGTTAANVVGFYASDLFAKIRITARCAYL